MEAERKDGLLRPLYGAADRGCEEGPEQSHRTRG